MMTRTTTTRITVLLCAAVVSAPSLADPPAYWLDHEISTNAAGAEAVYAADLDGDGDLDVLSASYDDDKIAWYENIHGTGTFGPERVITTLANGARSVFAADLDGDNDLDVLSAAYLGGEIAWFENTDGKGTFGPLQLLTNQALAAWSVRAADLNGDGKMDVVAAASFGIQDDVTWYEGLDGMGSFGPRTVISVDGFFDGSSSVWLGDLNGDNHVDVLSSAYNGDKIAWYENDGLATFLGVGTQHVITTLADRAYSAFGADLDGDGDIDVLSASHYDDKIAWYENTDGLGNFGPQQVITLLADGAYEVHAADIDGDGDIDVLSASYQDDKIAWYENLDGLGDFGAQQRIGHGADGAWGVFPADLDGDGDIDVLAASSNDNTITWYENSQLPAPVPVPGLLPVGLGVVCCLVLLVTYWRLAKRQLA